MAATIAAANDPASLTTDGAIAHENTLHETSTIDGGSSISLHSPVSSFEQEEEICIMKEEASPCLPAAASEALHTGNEHDWTVRRSVSPPEDIHQTVQEALRSSASSLSAAKARYHSVHRGAGIGKHMNGKVIGRATKLAQLEVATEQIVASSHPMLLTSPRILRSPCRKKSPIRWFPRKKAESYLERKIRMLQEKEGKVPSLDETLGAANLHLSRIEREKLAAQTAAAEAMNSRKGALVEASWCRILKLAGIPCKEAILELQKAEKKAAAALAEAESKGVIVYHGHAERESSSEAVTASLDTAFDVDKEVTAAIKIALRHVSQRDSERDSRRDASVGYGDSMGDTFLEVGNQSDVMTDDCDFEEQVQSPGKIVYSRPNGKTGKVQDSLVDLMVCRIIDLSLEHQTALAGVVATRGLSALLKEQSLEQELNEKPAENLDRRSSMSSASPKKGSDLGSILVKHVSRLQREVQAAKEANKLLQVEGEKRTAGRFQAKASHVESLDQILVKHVSKLERDRLAAQTSRSAQEKAPEETSGEANDQKIGFTTITEDKNRINGRKSGHAQVGSQVDSLDQILVKHMSRLEKEKLAAQTRRKGSTESSEQASNHRLASKIVKEEGNLNHIEHSDPSLAASPVESLDRILVKHMSRLEKEKLAAQASRRLPDGVGSVGTSPETSERELTRANDEQKKCDQGGDRPELLEVTNKSHKMHLEGGNGESMNDAYSSGSAPKAMQKLRPNDFPDLGSFLVKHECRLEKEKRNLSTLQADSKRQIEKPKQSYIETGLGDILVKRLSRLELQKANLCDSGEKSENNENRCPITNTERDETSIERNSELTHGQKTQFLKSKEMQGSWGGPSMMHDIAKLSPNVSRTRILRQKQMEDAWGGVSLGNALRPHVSKLEMEQAAWRRAEQEARQRPNLQRL